MFVNCLYDIFQYADKNNINSCIENVANQYNYMIVHIIFIFSVFHVTLHVNE